MNDSGSHIILCRIFCDLSEELQKLECIRNSVIWPSGKVVLGNHSTFISLKHGYIQQDTIFSLWIIAKKKKKRKENYYIKFMDYCNNKKIIKVDIGKEMIKNEVNFYH